MIKGLIGIGIGAGAMYLLDPERGAERRAQLRGKLGQSLPKTSEAVHAKAGEAEAAVQQLTAKVDEKAAEVVSAVPLPAEGAAEEPSEGASEGAGPSDEKDSAKSD